MKDSSAEWSVARTLGTTYVKKARIEIDGWNWWRSSVDGTDNSFKIHAVTSHRRCWWFLGLVLTEYSVAFVLLAERNLPACVTNLVHSFFLSILIYFLFVCLFIYYVAFVYVHSFLHSMYALLKRTTNNFQCQIGNNFKFAQ